MSSTTADGLAQGRAEKAGRYLTFVLGRETYGVPVLKVREIVRLPAITPVPGMPACVKGVINLRGRVLPVIDLRLRFELGEASLTDRNCIIVVQVDRSDCGHALLGLIVDAVEEVAHVTAGNLEPMPHFGGKLNPDYLLGVARLKGGLSPLLDIDKIIAADAGVKCEAAA